MKLILVFIATIFTTGAQANDICSTVSPEDRYQNANELHTDLLLSSDLGRSKVKRSRISIVFDKLFGSSDN